METLPFKNVDSALEYVDQYFTSKKLTKDVHLLGKIVNIQHLPDTDIPTYVIQVSILKGFFRTKLERIFVEAIKHPELDAELEIGDLVSWGASEIKSDVPFGFILFVYDLNLDVTSGQFKHKTVEKDIGQIIKNMPKSDLDRAMSNALAMREYDIDLLYGKILPECEFLVDGEKFYISCNRRGRDVTVCWNTETHEWSSGIERGSLEGLSFSSPRLFEQTVFNLTSDENYSKKARLNECLMVGIAVDQTKTVFAKLETDGLLELSFNSQEWNEILLGNSVSFIKTVSDQKNAVKIISPGDYRVDVSNGSVVIHYIDPRDEFFEHEVFCGGVKNFERYYS